MSAKPAGPRHPLGSGCEWGLREILRLDRVEAARIPSPAASRGRLRKALPTREPFHIICGFRSHSTNEYLRTHGGGGVAARSLHLVGKAIDIRVPGIELRKRCRTAVALSGGGVGIYPASDFVHVDVGPVRTW